MSKARNTLDTFQFLVLFILWPVEMLCFKFVYHIFSLIRISLRFSLLILLVTNLLNLSMIFHLRFSSSVAYQAFWQDRVISSTIAMFYLFYISLFLFFKVVSSGIYFMNLNDLSVDHFEIMRAGTRVTQSFWKIHTVVEMLLRSFCLFSLSTNG